MIIIEPKSLPRYTGKTLLLLQIIIIFLVIIIGAFEVDVSNWSPFAPNGFNAVMTGATVVFFSYLGYDVVTSSAEECKRPQVYEDPPGFSCLVVPLFPVSCIFFNIFLFAQLHQEAWLRFVVVLVVSVGIYAFYGQYHAHSTSSNHIVIYDKPALEDALITSHDQDSFEAI
ncbi:hypothetical protein NE237_011343 [Protea cynaroides]|uniref:Cationic amino acid transporter C-terminal domain-containing protein n=1 Tax=Protea cynaroides TaxID=273540 RepID=A0A9Q0JXU7_9MAGN|nr:hypothetical protein NE237_011343 [Protea cynaroides]